MSALSSHSQQKTSHRTSSTPTPTITSIQPLVTGKPSSVAADSFHFCNYCGSRHSPFNHSLRISTQIHLISPNAKDTMQYILSILSHDIVQYLSYADSCLAGSKRHQIPLVSPAGYILFPVTRIVKEFSSFKIPCITGASCSNEHSTTSLCIC